jgi:glutamyl-tRNA reductase
VPLVVVGLNHRTVPLGTLEGMTVDAARLPKALHDLAGRDHLANVVVVSTCARTEVYALAGKFHGAMSDLRNFLAEWSGTPPEAFADHLYGYYDTAAVQHLFRVAAGADSAVLGEGEILHQVRTAWDVARTEETAGPVLSTLFRQAVEVGKRVRSETAIARGTTSLSQAAVALAAEELGTLVGRTCLVVGAGEMGETTAVALGAVPGLGSILVANRTPRRAVELADKVGGWAVPWAVLGAALEEADVVLTSTRASSVLFDRDALAAVLERRGGRPLLVVDIAVPRDVDPSAGELDGVTLLDMEDLQRYADRALAERRAELPAVEAIIEAEVSRYESVAAGRQADPVVVALRARAETVRQAELERALGRLGDLDEGQRQVVEGLSRAIVAKLLHEPTVNVKAAAGDPQGQVLTDALQQLFDL